VGAGAKNWLNAMIFHFLAGAVTGSVFKTRTLLLIMSFVLGEAGLLVLVDPSQVGLWLVVNLTATQVGYLSGVLGRATLEQAGYSLPPVDVRGPY
jgi:hypothetical protein